MGMYTRIKTDERHGLKDGDIIQIKCGDDNLDIYGIGDDVRYTVRETPGDVDFSDGAYDGYLEGTGGDAWVVIKDHRVHDAFTASFLRDKLDYEEIIHEYLTLRFDLNPYDASWWSSDAWFDYKLKEAKDAYDRAQDHYHYMLSVQNLSLSR